MFGAFFFFGLFKTNWLIVELSDLKGLPQHKKFWDFKILCSIAQFLSTEVLFSLEAKAAVLYSGVPYKK